MMSSRFLLVPATIKSTGVFLLFLLSIIQSVNSLSTSVTTPPPPIKRVAVIGIGVAGLTLAHALENSPDLSSSSSQSNVDPLHTPIKVSLFESRTTLDFKAGGGLQLNGGMSVLRKINRELQTAVANAALPLTNIISRTKPWGESDEPFTALLKLNLKEAIQQTGGTTEEELIVDGEVMAYTIMRGVLQKILLEKLPPATAERVKYGKTLTGIESNTNDLDGGIMCQFDDGTSEGPFDLVVGCDGIKSAVKEYVEKGKISEDSAGVKRRSSIYSGIRIRFCIEDGDPNSVVEDESAEFKQYFGDGLYGLSAVYGAGVGEPSTKGAYLIFKDEDYNGPFKKKERSSSKEVAENSDWQQDIQSVDDLLKSSLDLIDKSGVPGIDLIPIIENADRVFELGVYFHNPFSLSGWSKEVKGSGGRFCVLTGDAAHAMPPFLGQGANQAVQDSYSLATKIFEYNDIVSQWNEAPVSSAADEEIEKPKTLQKLLKEYEHRRWLPTASITAKSVLLGYLETGQKGFLSKFRDAFFFVAGKVGIARKVFLDSATPKV